MCVEWKMCNEHARIFKYGVDEKRSVTRENPNNRLHWPALEGTNNSLVVVSQRAAGVMANLLPTS